MSKNSKVSREERIKRAEKKKKIRLMSVIAAVLILLLILFRFTFPVGWAKLFRINPLANDPAFVSIDGFDVSGDEFARFALQERDYYVKNFGDVSIGLMADRLVNFRDSVMVSIRYNYAFMKWAYDEGITEESVDDATVDEYISNVRDAYGSDEEFEKYLCSNYSDPAAFEQLTRRNLMIAMLEDKIYSGQSAVGDVTGKDCAAFYDEKNCVTVQQIVIPYISGNNKDISEKRAMGDEALRKVVGGTPFENVMAEHNAADSGCLPEGNIYFSDGITPDEFLDKAEGLEVGGVSGLFVAGDNFYILKRVDATDAMKTEQLRGAVLDKLASEHIQAITVAQDVKYSKRYKMVDDTNLVNPFYK